MEKTARPGEHAPRPRAVFARSLACAILIASLPARVSAAASTIVDPEPWEPQDLAPPPVAAAVPEPSVSKTITLRMIRWYQRDVATRSVSRCPFAISCSRYTAMAIERRGALAGVLWFIDRNLYRENSGTGDYYPWVEMPDGALKLDDRFFLDGPPPK